MVMARLTFQKFEFYVTFISTYAQKIYLALKSPVHWFKKRWIDLRKDQFQFAT